MKNTFSLLGALMLAVGLWAFTAGPGYQVGDYVKDFSLKNVNGSTLSLASMKDAKGAIVVFTCNTCPYSIKYEQRIIDLHNKYASQGYPVVAINPNSEKVQPGDSFKAMQERAKEYNYPFAYLRDESQEVAQAFGASRTPHVYLLEKDTKGWKVAYIGAIDNNHKDADAADQKYVEAAIKDLQAGKQPAEAETKAIGCTIKWKAS
jgi:peroxiredoxin